MLRPNSYGTEGGESEKRKGGKGREGIQRKNIEEVTRRGYYKVRPHFEQGCRCYERRKLEVEDLQVSHTLGGVG